MIPYLWHIVSLGFLAYMSQSIYSLYSLYFPAECQGRNCLKPSTDYFDPVSIRLYAALSTNIRNGLGNEIIRFESVNINEEFSQEVSVKLPQQTRKNGTLWIHAFVVPQKDSAESPFQASWYILQTTLATSYVSPQAKAFQLIKDEKANDSLAALSNRPVTHLRSILPLTMVSSPIAFDRQAPPGEIYHLLKLNQKQDYMPIFYIDQLSFRVRDLVEIRPEMEAVNLTVKFRPISVGRLRLLIVAQHSIEQMKQYGFSDKDVDEVKGIFTDVNIYFLSLTFFVAAVHILLDFLAFKNDVNFWRNRKTMTGLSGRTVLWSCFSHFVIFFYLFDEDSSKLVLIPTGIGAFIEVWKVLKMYRMRARLANNLASEEERDTENFDSQGMRYLALLLTPLCIGGAIYSLLYIPHKSWYSWVIQSSANGVYAFGFLFMLPQLFINYKLKSVAHLPWRAFAYKAFNTFIDDMFAFIIHMPTTHRLACFRDDVVFMIYLYQRYLYPVDKGRVNEFGESFEAEAAAPAKGPETKKTK